MQGPLPEKRPGKMEEERFRVCFFSCILRASRRAFCFWRWWRIAIDRLCPEKGSSSFRLVFTFSGHTAENSDGCRGGVRVCGSGKSTNLLEFLVPTRLERWVRALRYKLRRSHELFSRPRVVGSFRGSLLSEPYSVFRLSSI